MGWFDEQIRQRKTEDNRIFTQSLQEAAGAVLGESRLTEQDDRIQTAGALEKILRFYHLQMREVPDSIRELEEQLDYILHPQGMMYRQVRLDGSWYRDGAGAFLGFMKESGVPAVDPETLSR